jgi:hypothetical protein
VISNLGETGAVGGSAVEGIGAFGGGVISAVSRSDSACGSRLGGTNTFGGGGGPFSAADGADGAGFGARIWVRNSVNEECFDRTAWSGPDSGEIGSSTLSSQRRIWSRECEGNPANSSAATWPPSSRRLTIASPSILAAVSSAKEKEIFSDG